MIRERGRHAPAMVRSTSVPGIVGLSLHRPELEAAGQAVQCVDGECPQLGAGFMEMPRSERSRILALLGRTLNHLYPLSGRCCTFIRWLLTAALIHGMDSHLHLFIGARLAAAGCAGVAVTDA